MEPAALNGSACAGGGGVICECAACLGSGWFALPLHPRPPAPPPAPAPPLLCQPNEGGERRHPAAPAATAVSVSGNPSRARRWFYLFILFKGGGSLAWHTLHVGGASLPVLGACGMRSEGFPRMLALSRNENGEPVRLPWSSERFNRPGNHARPSGSGEEFVGWLG